MPSLTLGRSPPTPAGGLRLFCDLVAILEDYEQEFGQEEVEELVLDPGSQRWITDLVDKVVVFMHELIGFELFPYQVDFAKRLIESVLINDGEEITALFSRQSGKALALDCPIPTPEGWVQFGDLVPGDTVYGPDGGQIKVLARTPIWQNRPCYRVEMWDGTEIVADAAHEWALPNGDVVETPALCPQPGRLGAKDKGRVALPLTAPVKNDPVSLPIDPYVFGCWLADGNSYDARWTKSDEFIVDKVRALYALSRHDSYGPHGWLIHGIHTWLRQLGLLGRKRKHVPAVYLRADLGSRVALLQGLLDGDGYVSKEGECEFTTTHPGLAQDVPELLRSLGFRTKVYEKRATLYGKDCGPKWVLKFSAFSEHGVCPVTLPRKKERLRSRPTGNARSQKNWVVAVEPVPSVPVRCITVEGGVFLAGEGWVPTHNSETVADVVATLMILLPKFAQMYPDIEDWQKFKKGFWVGLFAPTDDQVETLFSRIVTRLSSDRATEMMLDPELDDIAEGKGKRVLLKKSGSLCRMQTANPRAKIESKSYHLIIVDESQDTDDYVVKKSIHPMGAFYNATLCKTGTPTTRKGDFYRAIQLNKRRATRKGHRVNHFEADWKYCAKYNKNYNRFVRKEMRRLGEDSDEFQLAYCLKWLLERGMFVTSDMFDSLGDTSMELVRAWWKTPVLVGIDPARTLDSTVVTVVWVDWDHPDEFGFYHHRVLNWLEIHGDNWEEQYGQIVGFLQNYNVLAGAVDAQGVGDAVADRLARLMPRAEWHALTSTRPDQSERWKHLKQLLERGMLGWPAHAKTRRLKVWQRFKQQMIDLEKSYEGPHLLAAAPDEPEAHDDFPDSLALACYLTAGLAMPEAEESQAPFYESRRERYAAGGRR